jgi:hypothetical protein
METAPMFLHLPPLFHGTLREHYLLLFGTAAAVGITFGAVSAWVGAQLAARRVERRLREERAQANALADRRMADLARAVDGVALEVERIAESNRFMAKLLAARDAERREPARLDAPPRRAPGAITPH